MLKAGRFLASPNAQNSVLSPQHSVRKRGQVNLRHTESPAYRCFLPDLAGFTGFCCTGPSPYTLLSSSMEQRRSNHFTAMEIHCLLVRLARHCPGVDKLSGSVAPSMAERVGFEVALATRAPTEGASPLVSPHAGEPLPRDPPGSNPTLNL